MKINRDIVTRAALKLLNEVGLERLTLRLLGQELKVQAATLYWHFKSKEELIDEMATAVLADDAETAHSREEFQRLQGVGDGVWNGFTRNPVGLPRQSPNGRGNSAYQQPIHEHRGAHDGQTHGFTVRQAVVLGGHDLQLHLGLRERRAGAGLPPATGPRTSSLAFL